MNKYLEKIAAKKEQIQPGVKKPKKLEKQFVNLGVKIKQNHKKVKSSSVSKNRITKHRDH
jgi:hypothetical protein